MKKRKETGVDLAVIGYSQAGKTTLAVGLYATSAADFSVTCKGEDTESYLRARKAVLESDKWLEKTAEREMPDLCLSINRAGRPPVEIRFKDYMGARACNIESFKRDVVGDPRGVIILLNPYMPILHDGEQRNGMIGQIKELVGYLGEPGMRCQYIALVVTASDRLATAPRDFAEEFEGYKAEITNCLNTSPFSKRWKEFAVTVSGELEEPTRARIARGEANTSREPFMWLLDEIQSADARARAKRVVKRGAMAVLTLALLGGAAFSWLYFWHDRQAERAIDKILEESSRPLELAIEKKEATKINSACQAMEKGREKLPSTEPYFTTNRLRLQGRQALLAEKIEDGRLQWYPYEFDRIYKTITSAGKEGLSTKETQSRLEDLKGFADKFATFKPRCERSQQRFRELCAAWEEVESNAIASLERSNGAWFAGQLKALDGQAGEKASAENCAKLRREIESWHPTGADCQADKKKLLASFDASLPAWRKAYERKRFADGVADVLARLPKAKGDIGSGNELHETLLACRTYEKMAGQGDASEYVTQDERKETWEKIEAARQVALDVLLDEQVARLDPKGKRLPEVSADDVKFLDTTLREDEALPDPERSEWYRKLGMRVGEIQRVWRTEQKRVCDEFVSSLASARDGYEVVHDRFLNFYSDYPETPYIRDVVLAVHRRLGIEFERIRDLLYTEWTTDGWGWHTEEWNAEWKKKKESMDDPEKRKRVRDGFFKLRELCGALARVRCGELKRSCWYQLAMQCRDNGCDERGTLKTCFPQKLTITRVDVKHDYSGNAKYKFNCSIVAKEWVVGSESEQVTDSSIVCDLDEQDLSGTEWTTAWTGNESVALNQWTYAYFSIDATKMNPWYRSNEHETGQVEMWVNDGCFVYGRKIEPDHYFEGTTGHFQYRIYVLGEGIGLRDIWPSQTDLRFE